MHASAPDNVTLGVRFPVKLIYLRVISYETLLLIAGVVRIRLRPLARAIRADERAGLLIHRAAHVHAPPLLREVAARVGLEPLGGPGIRQ
jgi:hypothetical protein